MDFLTNELFKIGSFTVQIWHLLVVVVALVFVICIIASVSCRKSKKHDANQVSEESTTVEQQDAVDQTEQSSVDVVSEAQPANQIDQAVADESSDETPEEQPVEDAVKEQSTDDIVTEEVSDYEQDEIPVDGQVEQTADKKPTVKNYHVSLRPDGKWQVKLSKGGKAIKLFDTQAEAITFAKARAKSQDGRITIHKVDGKIRKQKY